MFYRYIVMFFIAFSLFSKGFIVQKPIIFLTKPQKSKYELPVKVQNLIKINKSSNNFLDNLNYKARKKLVSYALRFNNTKGKRSRNFRNDCSGFTRKVYSKFNIELFRLPRHELKSINGKWLNGVELIWKYCKKHGKVFIRKTPKTGDIVFFDNTHDRNKNGSYDDYFTHVGIVVKVDKDKTIHYIHKATSGVKISKLNMKYKNKRKYGKKEINSYLRRRGKYRLSGQLLRGFGSIFSTSSTPRKDKSLAYSPRKQQSKDKSLAYPPRKQHSKDKSETYPPRKQQSKDKSLAYPPRKQHSKDKSLAYPPRKQQSKDKSLAYPPRKQHSKDKSETYPPRKSKSNPIMNSSRPYPPVQIIPKKYRKQIVKQAISYIGKSIKKEDFARKVYSDLGFNILDKEFNNEEYIERAIFWTFKKNGRLFSATKPKIGDLIFFDKLNGKNLFLNIAIIEKINKNQITFIHSLDGLVKRGFLNSKYWKLNKKDKKIINSYFIKNKNSRRKLASDFFRRFGSMFSK